MTLGVDRSGDHPKKSSHPKRASDDGATPACIKINYVEIKIHTFVCVYIYIYIDT